MACVEEVVTGAEKPQPFAKKWTAEMDAELLRYVRKALAAGVTLARATRGMARYLGVTEQAALARWYRLNKMLKRRAKKAKSPVGSAVGEPSELSELKEILLEKASRVEALTKEEIQEAADRAGTHYHTALSTLAALHRNGEVARHGSVLEDLARLAEERRDLEEKLAETRKRIAEIDEVFGRIGGLLKKTG
jgi:hypothetical protein